MKSRAYSVWRQLPSGKIIQAGLLAVDLSTNQKITGIKFQYTPQYIQKGLSSLDPINVKIGNAIIKFESNGELPGFIDDYLPDDWGQSVIAASQKKPFLNKVDMLDTTPSAVIGDLMITPGKQPTFEKGLDLKIIESMDSQNFNDNLDRLSVDYLGLKVLLRGGSGVGGARPKLLIEDSHSYIYKFNRTRDVIDVAANEWASLEVMRNAGLEVCEADVGYLLGRKYLRVRRFDLSEAGRYRLMTLNGLLKNPLQEDMAFPSYDAIAKLIRKHSINATKDIEQLVGQCLFNAALNNTDDHLRNFSFIDRGKGLQLSPAYDVLPSDTIGAYHQLTLNNGFIPSLEQAEEMLSKGNTKPFLGLEESRARNLLGRIKEAMQDFEFLVGEKEGQQL